MASDFQRPRSWMVSVAMLAQRSAVAPPGRRLRALRSPSAMWSVEEWSLAARRSAKVMCVGWTVRASPWGS
jgi:hypothetical protein